MPRKTLTTVIAAAALLALSATVAAAVRPVHGTFLNKSRHNGARVEASPYNLRTVSFYCADTRWDLIQFVHIRSNGSFRFSGQMRQYGHQAQPWGKHHVRFSGHFTSRRHVRIKRHLPGRCGTRTVGARVRR